MKIEEMHENGYVDDTELAVAGRSHTPFGRDFPSINRAPDRDYFTAAIVNEVEDLFPDCDMDSAVVDHVAVDEKLRRRRVMPYSAN
jgi:penicillin-binding protein 1A